VLEISKLAAPELVLMKTPSRTFIGGPGGSPLFGSNATAYRLPPRA
jgi:hypothetical protein